MKAEIRIKRNSVRNIAGGFTLVELLVVISIIALLLAVMIPSLQKARTVAKAVICSSNMKQQYDVQFAHATGNDGKFPYHGANQPHFYYIYSATTNNYPYRTDIYDAYKSYIGNPTIFVCPVTTKYASPDGKELGYYRDASWREPKQIWGWWYGGWTAKFKSTYGDLGKIVRQSPYFWFAAFKYNGYDFTLDRGEAANHILFRNKADQWALSQVDLRASSAFITHEIVGVRSSIIDRGHGGGPRVTDISLITRAVNPVTFGDGAVLKIPTVAMKWRASYTEGTQLIEIYW
jgi:prepilin-type N-terminal cleavage/methylation domain-containing protein